MPRASTRVTPDVSPGCEPYSSLRKQDWTGAPKNTARTIIAPTRTALTSTARKNTAPKIMVRTRTALTNTAPKSTILKNIDRVTWVVETASLHRREETE
jgi:hypothetical protein